MPFHHVKSHYNLILYYTSTYVERVGVSQNDNSCSFIDTCINRGQKRGLGLRIKTCISRFVSVKSLLLIFNIFSESQHIWMCPIIGLQCSVIDLLQSYNYCILFFIYWIDLLKVRVYIFYFTMYYKLLQYFFKEIGAKHFLLSFLFMIYKCTFCILYMLMFFFIFWWCTLSQMYINILYGNKIYFIIFVWVINMID